MKQRFAGLLLWLLLAIPSAIGWLATPLVILFADKDHAKQALRAFDELPSAVLFKGSAYISLSAWAWVQRGAWWADLVIWITDKIQPGHCEGAWAIESRILAAVQKAKEQ